MSDNFKVSSANIVVHASNLNGLGARIVLDNLLPELLKSFRSNTAKTYLPKDYTANLPQSNNNVHRAKCFFPNVICRLFDIFTFNLRVDDFDNVLVLGDLPLWKVKKQVVYIHQAHLLKKSSHTTFWMKLKFSIMRKIFSSNLKYVSRIIVQTTVMKDLLISQFPNFKGEVDVIGLPSPHLITKDKAKANNARANIKDLTFFYPAAFYPHKNHSLLNDISNFEIPFIKEIIITIPEENSPNSCNFIKNLGYLKTDDMISTYLKSDALLFLSFEESYGLPLVEAMSLGMPIICPDLPYARCLCGDEAIYFNPDDANDLYVAMQNLYLRLQEGWLPDWSQSISRLPRDWCHTAELFKKSLLGSDYL